MLEKLNLKIAGSCHQEIEPSIRRLLDSLPFIAFVAGPSGATLYTNQHYQAYTGLSAEALMGDGWALLIHAQDRANLIATWLRALDLGQAAEVEGRLRGSDGAYRWMRARVAPQRDSRGKIDYWLGVCADEHDLRLAESSAKEAGEWLRLAQQASGVGTFEWDPITQELQWSAECRALFGVSSDAEVTDELFFSRVHPEDREAVHAAIERTFNPAGVGEYSSQYRTLRPDGTLRWIDARGRATFEDIAGARRAVRFIGTVFDITDAKAREQALEQRKIELQAMANVMPSLVWVSERDGAVRYLNDRWYSYTGQTPVEALGNGWTRALHPDDAKQVASAWAESLAGGTAYEVLCRYRRADGVYRWHLARAEPLRDQSGSISSWVGTSVDIENLGCVATGKEGMLSSGPGQPSLSFQGGASPEEV